jgi:hypothetical protein
LFFAALTRAAQWIHEIEDEEPTGYIRYDKFESLMLR